MKVTKFEVVRSRLLVIKVFFDSGYELWFWPRGKTSLGHVELHNSKQGQKLVASYNVWKSVGGGLEKLTKCDRPMTAQTFADHWLEAYHYFAPKVSETIEGKVELTDDLRDIHNLIMPPGAGVSIENLRRSRF